METSAPAFTTVSIAEWLPSSWREDIHRAVRQYGKDVRVKGRGPGSLEDDSTAGLDYRVVDGEAIRDHVVWLWSLYQSQAMVDLVEEAVGKAVKPSLNPKSAININHLRGTGGRYELHVDGQPYSAVLMCNTMNAETGGRLHLGGEFVDPKPGLLVIFDGSVIPHAVEPLKLDLMRTSLPLVYVPTETNERPDGLDDYLYKST